MLKKIVISFFALGVLAGCSSVPMESVEKSNLVKQFSAPKEGSAGLYVYRAGSFGGALKKSVWVDGKCLGETAPDVFFYDQIKGGTEHKLSTESEFSANDLVVKMDAGKNYFVRQYIKLGVFVGGAGLELVSEEDGKKAVSGLGMATPGTCN